MSIKYILKGHFSSFNFKDKFIFLYGPTIFAISCALFISKHLTNDIINIFLISLSILVGFLLNLLVISISIRDDKKKIEVGNKIYNINYFLEEFNDNICFGILVALTTIIILIAYSICSSENLSIIYFFNILTIIFITWFFITLFMLLKRAHLLFKYYLKE